MGEKSLKDRVIETSLKLFEEHGFHKVSVDQIVKESGTSKGGFYHNFESKDELLYIIHDHFISYVLEKGQKAYEQWQTPTERLYAIVKSFVLMIDLFKSEVTVFYEESSYLAPEYVNDIKQKRDKYTELILKVVQEGKDSGEFRKELPTSIFSMAIFGMVNWTYKWYRKNGEYTIEKIAEIYADIVLNSVITAEAKMNPKFSRLFIQSPNKDIVIF